MKNLFCLAALILYMVFLLPGSMYAQAPGDKSYITSKGSDGYFPLSLNGKAAPIYAGDDEYPGVTFAIKSLQTDITSVTKTSPELLTGKTPNSKEIVLIGTIGKNTLIDKLVLQKKLNVSSIEGKWEAHITQVINNT